MRLSGDYITHPRQPDSSGSRGKHNRGAELAKPNAQFEIGAQKPLQVAPPCNWLRVAHFPAESPFQLGAELVMFFP
jgi:hypothetical protein